MKQEDKELLLKDLCARLPYNVIVHIHDFNTIDYDNYLYAETLAKFESNDITLKPYLRPMSSMMEEEKQILALCNAFIEPRSVELKIDFYNEYYLDYRGLIEKGLALVAPEGVY